MEVKNPIYKYYTKGLFIKILGGISLCLIYQLYYSGGDTVNYFVSSEALLNLAFKKFSVFWDIAQGQNTYENKSYFDIFTGWPVYWKDSRSLYVAVILTPFLLLSFKSYVASTVILAWVCYVGIWKLFILFTSQFPQITKNLAIAILFIPSVVFWGSGMLKDSITLSAIGWYTYYFYFLFIKRKYNFSSTFFIITSCYLLLSIKPYILFALLPGSIIWLANDRLQIVQSEVLRKVFAPLFISIGALIGFLLLSQLSGSLGAFSVDKVLDKAVESNVDQKSDHYKGNSFDIGDFDASLGSMASKAHLAIAYGLFGPFLWNVKNPVMLLSALENTYILSLTFFLLLKLKFVGFFTLIWKNPLVLFSVLFSLFFAFSVGIATSNFGSLVRLKIPCIPFFVSSLFVLKYFYDEQTYLSKHRYTIKKQQKNKANAS